MTTRVLFISDLHSGSLYSVCHPEIALEVNRAGGPAVYEANARQRKLREFWEIMLDEVGRVDACVVLGDSTDGSMIRSRGYELWTPNIHQQISCAVDLLKEVRTPAYLGVDGSPYHTGQNPSWDLAVIDALDGRFGTDLALNVEDKRLHLLHWTGFSRSAAGQHTSSSNENIWSAANEPYYGHFDMTVRGHKHIFDRTVDLYGDKVTVPGWKLRDPFMQRGGLSGQPPQVGYVLMTFRHGMDIDLQKHVWVGTKEDHFEEVYL